MSHNYFVPGIIEEVFEGSFGVSYLRRGQWTYVQAIYGKSINEFVVPT